MTDIDTNIVITVNKIQEAYPHIVNIRCSAHVLNLLIKDIAKLPSINKTLLSAKTNTKEITHSKYKTGLFNDEGEKYTNETSSSERRQSLSLPCETCWYSIQNMLEKFRKSKHILLRMSIDDNSNFCRETNKLLKEDSFLEKN